MSSINTIFREKLLVALKNNLSVISLEDDDFKDYEADWENLPLSFSSMIELVKINNEDKINIILIDTRG